MDSFEDLFWYQAPSSSLTGYPRTMPNRTQIKGNNNNKLLVVVVRCKNTAIGTGGFTILVKVRYTNVWDSLCEI